MRPCLRIWSMSKLSICVKNFIMCAKIATRQVTFKIRPSCKSVSKKLVAQKNPYRKSTPENRFASQKSVSGAWNGKSLRYYFIQQIFASIVLSKEIFEIFETYVPRRSVTNIWCLFLKIFLHTLNIQIMLLLSSIIFVPHMDTQDYLTNLCYNLKVLYLQIKSIG